jgi:hypothetical protein
MLDSEEGLTEFVTKFFQGNQNCGFLAALANQRDDFALEWYSGRLPKNVKSWMASTAPCCLFFDSNHHSQGRLLQQNIAERTSTAKVKPTCVVGTLLTSIGNTFLVRFPGQKLSQEKERFQIFSQPIVHPYLRIHLLFLLG